MSTFRSDDYVSLQIVFMAIFSAIILLTMAYFALKFFQKRMILGHMASNKQLINVLESRYIPNLGHLFLISFDEKKFLAVSSKFGVKMLQVTENYKPNQNMDEEEVNH